MTLYKTLHFDKPIEKINPQRGVEVVDEHGKPAQATWVLATKLDEVVDRVNAIADFLSRTPNDRR